MNHPLNSNTKLYGPGSGSRRSFMKMGLAGFGMLSLPGLLRLRAASAAPAEKNKSAVIMVWQPGGCSHIESYDPKPDASSEYRGPYSTIPTKVPGLNFCELMPRQAAIADKFTVLRSMRQGAGGHPAGSMQMLSGDSDTRDKPKPRLPDWMSVTNYLRSQEGPRTNPLPAYVGINPPTSYNGPGLSRRRVLAVLGDGRPQRAEVRRAEHRALRRAGSSPPQPTSQPSSEPRHSRAGF